MIKNVLSLFNGLSCGRLALDSIGIPIDNYFTSEIKESALRVTDHNYPQDIKNKLGDITKIKGFDLPTIDLLIGGSPCQDMSGANRERKGLQGRKSGLFWEYVRLLEETKPKYFLLENVRMQKQHQDVISSVLGCEPVIINSSLVAPQLRHRLYWTNIPFYGLPIAICANLNDYLQSGYSDRTKARALLESDSRPLSTPVKMCHRYFGTGFSTLIFLSEQHYVECKQHYTAFFKGKKAIEIDAIIAKGIDLSVYDGVRYMNNREREFCQTVPQGYTDILNQNDAASVLGDGWTVDIIAHIFRGLL